MADKTGIEWCDSTANYWEGCTEVSKEENGGGGCDNCYAESMNRWLRRGENWGPGAPRRKILTTSRIVRSWQRNAEKFRAQHGRRRRVFVNSISDTFDNEVDQAWREELYADARDCPDLLFCWLTKRIGNAESMLPRDWGDGYPNVMLLATVVNQREVDRDVPKLLELPARWRGLSVEPQLGPIDCTHIQYPPKDFGTMERYVDALNGVGYAQVSGDLWRASPYRRLDLVINGFESGRKARPVHPDYARILRDQCAAAGTAYFFKQWGEWICAGELRQLLGGGMPGFGIYDACRHDLATDTVRVGKKAAGRLLDGREHTEFPKDFR